MSRRETFNLAIHDAAFSKEELVINPDCFPANGKPKVGDIIEITNPENNKRLYLPITSVNPVKGKVIIIFEKIRNNFILIKMFI